MPRSVSFLLWLEPIWLAITLLAFWYPSPTRDSWLWLLWALPFFAGIRYATGFRLDWRQPLLWALVIGFGLMWLNVQVAPYTRGLLMLGRPLLGLALILAVTDQARRNGHLKGAANAALLLSALLAFLSLTAAQWTTKSQPFALLVTALPRFTLFPGAEGGFNVNELGGALTFLTPLCAGLSFYGDHRSRRWGFAVVTGALLLGAFLGQSRFALAGILLAVSVVVVVILRGRRRWVALGLVALLVALQAGLVLNVFMPAQSSSRFERDESSMSIRFDIWGSALAIIRDHPLTGVGLAMFRDGRVREQYPVPSYGQSVLPHAHNELLQVGADMGVPGMVWFIGLHAAAAWMLIRAARRGSVSLRALAAGVGGGMLAHSVFGLGDAIALWDRFAFLLWFLLALAAGAGASISNQTRSAPVDGVTPPV